MNLSAFVVLPVAFVFVSYLQHQKDKADKALSLGIVKDPKVSFLDPLLVACASSVYGSIHSRALVCVVNVLLLPGRGGGVFSAL